MQILNLKGSVVDIAHDYAKRKHVLRLTTVTGSEYLFQVRFLQSNLIFNAYAYDEIRTKQPKMKNVESLWLLQRVFIEFYYSKNKFICNNI